MTKLMGKQSCIVITSYSIHYTKLYDYPRWGISRINDTALSIRLVDQDPVTKALITTDVNNVVMKTKAIQDEQGETFDPYGRMRASLGLELANA